MNDNIDQHGNPIPGLDVDGNPTGNVGAGNVGAGNVGAGNVERYYGSSSCHRANSRAIWPYH
jgi:hypothetical protein